MSESKYIYMLGCRAAFNMAETDSPIWWISVLQSWIWTWTSKLVLIKFNVLSLARSSPGRPPCSAHWGVEVRWGEVRCLSPNNKCEPSKTSELETGVADLDFHLFQHFIFSSELDTYNKQFNHETEKKTRWQQIFSCFIQNLRIHWNRWLEMLLSSLFTAI